MEKKRREKGWKTGPEERDKRLRGQEGGMRRRGSEDGRGGGGDVLQQGSEPRSCSCFFFFFVVQLPQCGWFLLFLLRGCNVYFQLRVRPQPS